MFDLLEFVLELFGEPLLEGLAYLLSSVATGFVEMARRIATALLGS